MHVVLYLQNGMAENVHNTSFLIGGVLLADNIFLPSSLANVSLPVATITATGFVQADLYTIKVIKVVFCHYLH